MFVEVLAALSRENQLTILSLDGNHVPVKALVCHQLEVISLDELSRNSLMMVLALPSNDTLEGLCLHKSELNHEVLSSMLSFLSSCTRLRLLRLRACRFDEAPESLTTLAKLLSCLSRGGREWSLDLTGCNLTDCVVEVVAGALDGARALTSLDVSGCACLSDLGLQRLSSAGRELHVFSALDCRSTSPKGAADFLVSLTTSARVVTPLLPPAATSDRVPRLSKLCLQRVPSCGIVSVGDAFGPSLRELHVPQSPRVDDEALTALASACPLLETLNVEKCPLVGDEAIVALSQHCKHLAFLNVKMCVRVSDEGVIALCDESSSAVIALTHLLLSGLKRVTDASLLVIGSSSICRSMINLVLLKTSVSDQGTVFFLFSVFTDMIKYNLMFCRGMRAPSSATYPPIPPHAPRLSRTI